MIRKTVECGSVAAFLDHVVVSGPTPRLACSSFLYRGVGNGCGSGEHRLIPSSLRPDRFPKLMEFANPGSGPPPEYTAECMKEEWVLARLEAQVLGKFFRYADAQGQPMPEITSLVRRTMQLPSTSDALFNHIVQRKSVWPPDELLPLAGQAQHFGLPTRLLDWSRDPWVAVYFAAEGGMRRLRWRQDEETVLRRDNSSSIAVWVLGFERLDNELRLVRGTDSKTGRPVLVDAPVSLVTAPASTNANLRAQQGVFTVWRPQFSLGPRQSVDRRPLDELIAEALADHEPTLPLFHKFTLPLMHVPELWKTLRRAGTSRAKLFPGYRGAVEAIEEEARFARVD